MPQKYYRRLSYIDKPKPVAIPKSQLGTELVPLDAVHDELRSPASGLGNWGPAKVQPKNDLIHLYTTQPHGEQAIYLIGGRDEQYSSKAELLAALQAGTCQLGNLLFEIHDLYKRTVIVMTGEEIASLLKFWSLLATPPTHEKEIKTPKTAQKSPFHFGHKNRRRRAKAGRRPERQAL